MLLTLKRESYSLMQFIDKFQKPL